MLRRLLNPLGRRIRLLISRGVVDLVNDSLKCQGLQVSLLADEVRDAERFEDYGMTSHPESGAEVLFLSVGGNRSHGIVARVLDRRYRPLNMDEGDVCLYTRNGERVYLDDSGDIVNLGAKSAADFVALAQKVLDELTSISSAISGHTHSVSVPATPFTGATGPGATYTASSVAASKVKAT